MEVFNLTLTQMLNMFTLIVLGYILKKTKIIPDGSDTVISRLETYAFVPALTLGNQIANCTVENFLQNYRLMFYGLAVGIVAIGIAYPLSEFFVKKSEARGTLAYQKQIYKYGLTFGNYGYVGNFLVLGIWGQEMFFKYLMFTFFPGLLCYAWGIYILIPKSESSPGILKNLKNGMLKPPFLSMLAGMALGLSGLGRYIPSFISTALNSAGSCMGPAAMILAGIVIGSYDLKELIGIKKVYTLSILRLVVIPAVFVAVLKLIDAPEAAVVFTLMAYAAPLGMNTIVYPAAFGGETKTGAAMTTISSVLSVITIPVMYLIFVELL